MGESKRFPLASILAPRNNSTAKDGILANCYHESTPTGEAIVKRPGYSVHDSFGVGCAQGGITYNGEAIWVIADQLVTGEAGIPVLPGFSAATTPPKPTAGSSATAKGGYLVSHLGALYSIGGRNNGDTTISVYKSVDNGTSWSTASTPWTTTVMQDVNVAASLGALMYAGGVVTTRGIYSSPDGVTWTLRTTDLAGGGIADFHGMIAHNNKLYALLTFSVAAPQIWSSSNGITWVAENSGISGLAARTFSALLSLNNRLYLIGGLNTSTNTAQNDVWVSVDNGVSWVILVTGAPFSARAAMAAWTLSGRLWIAGGATGPSLTSEVKDVWSSENGSAWLQAAATSSWSIRSQMSFAVHNSALYIGPGKASGSIVSGLFFAAPSVTSAIPLVPAPSTSCLPFQLTLIPATPSTPVAVFLKNRDVAYYYNGLSVVRITDPDYPITTVFGVVYLDGYIFVMNQIGQIFNSNLSNQTSWNALDFISANAEADIAIALVRQLNYVVALKEYSTEFFYDAGNATGSPLGKVLNALLEIGCASSGSIAFADNTFYFMANARQKGRSIMKMEGYTPKYISNPYIDRIMNGDDLAGVYAFVIKTNGHFFYVLTLTTSAITLVYDEVTSEWHTWSHMTSVAPDGTFTLVAQADGSIMVTSTSGHGQADGNVVTIAGASISAANGQFNIRYDPSIHTLNQFSYVPDTAVTGPITGAIVVTFYSETYFPGVYYAKGSGEDLLLDQITGDVYQFDPDIFQDNALPINLRIRTAILDFGSMKTKRYSRLELVGDKVTTNVLMRFSDDDYDSWSLYRIIPMAQRRAKISNLGSARRIAFEFRHTGNTALRLLAAELDVDEGVF